MSELEKKFSDFQKNECDTQEVEQPIDERLCPDCFPNPNFKLPDKWFLIKESYLNEEFCEYHYRVAKGRDAGVPFGQKELTDEEVIEIAIERMIVDFEKVLNNQTREALRRVASIVKRSDDENAKMLGEICLVAVPSFNFDQLPDLEDEEGEQDENEDENIGPQSVDEIILNYKGLFKKTIQLGGALRVYGYFYASSQHLKDVGLQLVYQDNPQQRVNYSKLRKNLKSFVSKLNIVLRQNNFQGIDYPSLAKKRWERIKFVYKKNQPFVLKAVYVLDENCGDQYTKIKIPASHELLQPGFESTNAFMANLETVINDITAQQTKPWLEFSLDNIYPPVVANYGDLDSFSEDDYVELGCLLEKSLGIGNGQVTDYLSKQVLSFFKTLENEMYKSACRSINNLVDEGTDAKNQQRQKTPYEERKERTIATYKRQYIENVHVQVIDYAKKVLSEPQAKDLSKSNVFRKLKKFNLLPARIDEPAYDFKNDNGDRGPAFVLKNEPVESSSQIENMAITYAENKFANLDKSWGDRFKNNADWEEMKEAYNEPFKRENGFLQFITGSEDDDSDNPPGTDSAILNTIGLCGISKLTGNILKCLLGGVTIQDFYDIMIQKTLEYMDVNVFGLFLNGLPLSFREELDEAISQQFGGVSLTDLINMKVQSPSKLKDSSSFQSKDRIVKIFERSYDPLSDSKITDSDKDFLRNNIGNGEFYLAIQNFYSSFYNIEKSSYDSVEGFKLPIPSRKKFGEMKEYKSAKKYAKKLAANSRRSYLGGSDTFSQASEKLNKTILLFGDVDEEATQEELRRSLNQFERADKNLSETNIGVKVDAVYDVVFDFAVDFIIDSLSVDFLIEQASQYPGADLAIGFVTDFLKSCPHPTLFHPPAGDFMKSFSLDVCDPELSLTLPKINFPSLSLRYNIDKQFQEAFRNAIVELISKIAIGLLKRITSFLEDALCKTIGALGTFAVEGLQNGNLISGAKDNFEKALDQIFCGGSTNPNTGRSRANELANGLFKPALAQSGADYEGSGDRVSNIISSVLSQDEIMRAIVDGDDRANKMISNAIDALAPEMKVLLGSPDQVAVFFENLRSYIPEEEQQRIRDLLDAGIPNLPLTASICLTNDQLKAWNDLRNSLLQDMGLTPEQAAAKVNALNQEVLDQLEKTIGDSLELDSPDGPFVGALTDEVMKDVCNPKNLINDTSSSELGKLESSQLNEQYFQLLLRIMMISFNGRNGIFGNALRDRENVREGAFRNFRKFINPNYGNSQAERSTKYDNKMGLGQFIMSQLTEGIGREGEVIGDFPETVALSLKDQMLDNLTFNLPVGFSTVYEENPGEASHYKARNRFFNLNKSDSFSYDLGFVERLGSNQSLGDNNYTLSIPISTSEGEISLLENMGIQPKQNVGNLRQNIFSKHVSSILPLQKDYTSLYNKIFEFTVEKMVEASIKNEQNPQELSSGFLFGYASETISGSHWEYLNPEPSRPGHTAGEPYNYDEEDKVLGKYGNDRIKVLSPEVYGGRYSNPPYTIEPRKFVGWIEYATKAFESQEGCDPKRPPMLSLLDIKQRVDFLEDNLRNYPELTKDKECISEKPFKLLINNKTRAKMDGVVRSTLRAYLAEYFLKGIGVFSNVHYRPENFDSAFSAYITNKMREEMSEIGPLFSIGRKSIENEKYWYTFLEQCVQSYQTMYDLKEVSPTEEVISALESISQCQMAYPAIDRSTKKRMKKVVENLENRPNLSQRMKLLQKPAAFCLYAMDFRLSEDKNDYFGSGEIDSRITKGLIRRSSVKKLRFFSKIFAIRMFEKEATIVLRELIQLEAARLSEFAFEGLNDKPLIYDVDKSFVGLKTFFPSSSSRVGFNSYNLNKQLGTAIAGDVPDVKPSNANPPAEKGENVKFVVEKYVRIKSKDGVNLSLQNGVQPVLAFDTLIRELSSFNPENYLSDYFGNLSFTYKGSFRKLMDKGFANTQSINRLQKLNIGTGVDMTMLQNSLNAYIGLRDFQDFQVIYDDTFLLEGETPQPFGTTGSLDINYGIRISCVLPEGTFNDSEMSKLKQDAQLKNLSNNEKCLLFQDNTVILPLVQAEVSAVDAKVREYFPAVNYDLECLINKMVETPEYKLMFDKLFPLKMATSTSAIFCSENFMKSIGKGENERTDNALAIIEAGEDADEWEGVMNEFLKNFLRREFQSTYLSNDIGSFSADSLADRERNRLFGSFNPFDAFSLPSVKIPWFRKRRLKTKVYDADGNECADPVKDFE